MRYATLCALCELLAPERSLLPPEQLLQLAGDRGEAVGGPAALTAGGLEAEEGGPGLMLGRLLACLDEDYEPDTRQRACHALHSLLCTGQSDGPVQSAGGPVGPPSRTKMQ